MVRQDLEQWASRRSTLGDAKFRIVFDFLTHPKTLARPEFSRANDLVSLGAVKRTGQVFEDFFSCFKVPEFTLPANFTGINLPKYMASLEGCYISTDGQEDICLSISQFPNSKFFICHLFTYPQQGLEGSTNWNMTRASGFLTLGNLARLHVRYISDCEASQMYLKPALSNPEKQVSEIMLIYEELSLDAIHSADKSRPGKSINPNKYAIFFERMPDKDIIQFIENFRWNVVI